MAPRTSSSLQPSRSLRAVASSVLLGAAMVAGLGVAPEAHAFKWTTDYNHPDLKWQTIETEHFYVHYPVSKKGPEGNPHYVDATWAARKVATVSDEMWEPMCAEFNYYLVEKVHIMLLDQPDDLEGFTVPAFDWIVISANPGGSFYRMRGRMEWFADVMVHEFAHVVSLKEAAPYTEHSFGVGIGGLYQDGVNDTFTGGEIFLMDTDPTWWVEGGAEYWSDEAGYNWWTPSRDQNLRATMLEERWLNADEWISHGQTVGWGDGERRYQQGYSFALYLRQRFGDDAYTAIGEHSAKKWKADWRKNVQEVTGFTVDELHADHKAYLMAKYEGVREAVRDSGEAVGRELITAPGAWEYTDPAGRDAWYEKPFKDRKDEREQKGGTWDFHPQVSQDGRWFAEVSRAALVFKPWIREQYIGLGADFDSITNAQRLQDQADKSGRLYAAFDYGFDFIPGRDAVVVTANEGLLNNPAASVERDGYDWNQLYIADLTSPATEKRKHADGKEEVATWSKFKWNKHAKKVYTPIPNTQRGVEPRVSPDGQWVAYFEYASGTHNLAVIKLDGSEKRLLTDYHDGTWMQSLDWSPDGTKLLLTMFHNFEQDMYLVDVASGKFEAWTRDKWEVQDPHWANDGWIYFSAEPEGIFNIYRMNPETRDVQQVTNVFTGAQMPHITPEGDLLYVNFTGHGWKGFSLERSEFLLRPVGAFVTKGIDQAEVQADLAYSEDLSHWGDRTGPYRATLRNWMSPTIIPMVRLDNDSMVNLALSGGFQFQATDFVQNHQLSGQTMLGEDSIFSANYMNNKLALTWGLLGGHYRGKFDYALLIDDDEDLDTTFDQSVWDGKNHSYQSWGGLYAGYAINHQLQAFASLFMSEFGFRGSSDSAFNPYMRRGELSLSLSYTTFGDYGRYVANARGGRVIDLNVGRAHTDIVFASQNGHDTDDGQIVDAYGFNSVQIDWTEQIPSPSFGSKWLKKQKPTIQLNWQAGVIDRNVQFQDEFRAGGAHPYQLGYSNGNVQPNNQFQGYPAWSLSGETMIVMAAAYRVPLLRDMRIDWGILHLHDLIAQVSGTAGNLWSYRIADEAIADPSRWYYDGYGQRVAYDSADVRREIPFVDSAYKNGNYMLYDAAAELRLRSALMNSSFDSFVRVAYGFQPVSGINDINGDDINDTSDPGTGNSISQEREKPGPRIFIGVGTGW